jgi:hypothetical protein
VGVSSRASCGRSSTVADHLNRADAAFAELEALRAEAERLGLEDYRTDPLTVLRERVERARAES